MNKDVSAHTKRDRSKRNEEILGENRGISKESVQGASA